MNVEPESKTNEYLKGIVANLPEYGRNDYIRWKGKKSKEKGLFLFQQRA